MKTSNGEKVFDIFNVILMILFMFICIYPFIYVIALSFNDGIDAMRGGIYFFPRKFTLENYAKLFEDDRIITSFFISVFRTVVGASLGVIVNSMFAYGISKSDMPFRKFFNWMIVIPMYFGGGIIPYFLICKALNLTNNILVYVIPWLATPFYIMLLRISIKDLPESLEESAHLDGANYWTIYWHIVMPLIKPALATVILLGGIAQWNDWLDGTIMVSDTRLWPMQTLLLNILQGADMMSFFKDKNLSTAVGSMARKISITPESLKMAMLVVTVAPIFMVYPFAQKYFIKGILVGSIKG
ncbi:carbohydrate ABC transporter permease [Mahella australiensis]|uniref:Binding-protein-dependent transport systems inner membrane component n=1 Tax=Mahella australiensis (strain DSM 15567 / CIP 107919 / 50-1 BON) TaxID=697281 RepID=F4A114_MAHA5|nr:carbohydrate ABC transporter permease [Mahella australiensis]AEE98091.1 binding-protein-dependent transport systems inner membrane component [Mahella australiensis 50-1 BON]